MGIYWPSERLLTSEERLCSGRGGGGGGFLFMNEWILYQVYYGLHFRLPVFDSLVLLITRLLYINILIINIPLLSLIITIHINLFVLHPHAFWLCCLIYIYIIHMYSYFKPKGTRSRSWLSHYATSRKVAVSIHTGFFNWPNTSSLGSTQPLTEMSNRNFPAG
jgi:hypothetical protein